jgi:hypothetical protein
MKFDIRFLDEKSSKRESRENWLSDIHTLGFMSSGMSPCVGLFLTDVSEGTLGLHHQMPFFMDCLNPDTWRQTIIQNSGHTLPNNTASHQVRPGCAGTPSWERHVCHVTFIGVNEFHISWPNWMKLGIGYLNTYCRWELWLSQKSVLWKQYFISGRKWDFIYFLHFYKFLKIRWRRCPQYLLFN